MLTQDPESQTDTVANHSLLRDQLKCEENYLKQLHAKLWYEELSALKAVVGAGGTQKGMSEDLIEFENKARIRRSIKTYLAEIEEDIHVINAATVQQSQTLSRWAEAELAVFEHPTVALSTVSTVGAGLTYTTIFSATRGDIGYMTWSFALFLAGIVTSMAISSLLAWCARHMVKHPFRTHRQWEFAIMTAFNFSVLVVLGALFLLMCPLLTLKPDSQVFLTFSSKSPAIFAYSLLGLGIVATMIAIGQFAGAHGLPALLGGRNWERRLKEKEDLEKLKALYT